MENKLNIGIVADWLVTFAGAERVIAEFLELYPEADLYAVIEFLHEENKKFIHNKKVNTTFIQSLPWAKKKYQNYLPLMPLAVEQLDVSGHDIILSSSHAVAKGILTGPDQLHISYVHSPIRYAWDLQHQYLREAKLEKGIKSLFAKIILHKMRIWDYRTANSVDHFIANSHFIARRIAKIYGRKAEVIYPPVDVNRFNVKDKKNDYYLTASRLVPYKRIDLIVEAFSSMPDKTLVVIGDGSEMNKIKSKASRNIEILGYQPNEVLVDYMQNAKAFVFAAEEDFGITPVEAMACGTPVIAFGKGGALETIRPLGESEPTGIFFDSQLVSAVVTTVETFENNIHMFTSDNCRKQALKFSADRFKHELQMSIQKQWETFSSNKKIIY
ncbi:glycosyltransferase family 4 protein [Klebsiella quasipneumoniae]|jgi:glycosyltransferase involved in cell wall biosynthesis|uniref:glycosyltransferase family 4 protein n=1 Tax=Klebsiella quasipneumoniae TaxID=1463165 RepID=UPI000A0F3D0C|nr:glycosyltransferase family 4 protein [Klebsiella quasipneumoniae]KAE9753634.1 glycosyltransferase [Enterobacteriaceae bacterium TzEc084]MVX93886.1 glycosyltransferase [Enterobacteriaceae bacterium 8376wB9]MVY08030.1 glycosyltransferase [Enterobacteriaceae bacterium 8376wH8]MBF7752322.1 glycosyltransferase family 4 protein [Klebsiella quasipneumoniae]MBF7780256.1 glycosyltransferase family 4 protein [Klebsiella quasipneumoniae]